MVRLLFAGARCRVGECLVSAAGLDWPAADGFTGPVRSCCVAGLGRWSRRGLSTLASGV